MTEDNYISWHHYEGKLSDLFSLSSKPAFLVGAGISHDPPSNLPTGYQFTKEVLQQLLPTDQVEPILELTNPDRANMRSESDFLRFEQIMGHVQESIDPDLHVLDILSECTFPNSNHLFLAEAAKIGCPIITTNFDSLIEHALIALGLKKDEIYPVITREDWMMEPGNKIPVYKLHGSLMNVSRDLDTRSSIQATLRQISRGKGGESPILESWKLNTLKHILVNHDLIILGYSGYDDLDIIPTLKLIQSEKCIIWIAHSSDPRADIDIIDYIEDRRGWTFRESQKIKRGSERAYGHSGDFLHDVVDVGSRDGNSIFRIEINTANFLAFLRNTLILPKTETINKIEGKPVDTTLKIPELDGEIKMTLATKIWKGIERIGPAMEVGLKALEIIEMSDNDQNKAELYMNLGQIEEARGNLGIALTYYQKALSIFRKIGSIHDISLVLYDIGRIQYKESEPMVAMRSVQEGLSMSIDARDSFGHVVGLNLCGLIRRSINELNDALNDFRNAISAASEAGNILEKANSFRYIGETVIQKK
ncbi:MAG: SIR2 family protein, partial [Promethearchaeota archaeon]